MILPRYIASNLVKGWLLALVVLGSVFGLLGFIEELDRIHRDYTALDAARYTVSVLPNQLVGLAPVIALLGSIIALANLERFNELTVISCTGFSRSQLLRAVIVPTLALMVFLWVCMEYLTPQLQQSAEEHKVQLRHGDQAWIPGGGLWSNNGRRYIHIGRLSSESVPGAISLFEFDEDNQLQRTLRAKSAVISTDRTWTFKDVQEKRRLGDELQNRSHDELRVANLWAKEELSTLSFQQDTMNLSVLYAYTQYLRSTAQPVERHLHTFWQRMMLPFTVLAMVLMATSVSASVSAGRDRSFGLNIGIGAVLGIVFYLASQIIFALGQLFGWSIPLVASLPALVIFICALLLMRRMRW